MLRYVGKFWPYLPISDTASSNVCVGFGSLFCEDNSITFWLSIVRKQMLFTEAALLFAFNC